MSGQLWCPGGGRPEPGLCLVSPPMGEEDPRVEVEVSVVEVEQVGDTTFLVGKGFGEAVVVVRSGGRSGWPRSGRRKWWRPRRWGRPE